MNMSGDIICPPTALYAMTALWKGSATQEVPCQTKTATAAWRTKRFCFMVPSTLLDSSFGGTRWPRFSAFGPQKRGGTPNPARLLLCDCF